MQDYIITKLIGLKDIKVKNVEVDEQIIIDIQLTKPRVQKCPNCGSVHMYYHDKRKQKIKDLPIQNKSVILNLTRYRYKCKECGKKSEKQPKFVQKKCQMTDRLKLQIYKEYNDVVKVKKIAETLNISTATIQREIDKIRVQRKTLSEVMCIDEFKGDSGKEKYQVSIGNGKDHEITDILPSRKIDELSKYFSKITKEEREKVKYYVSDMSPIFKKIREIYFPNSVYITDRYHFIRQVTWALENVRKEEQKKMNRNDRIYFKRSRSLLHKTRKQLTDEEKLKVSLMLEKNENIRQAYKLKERFYQQVLTKKTKEEGKKALREWVQEAEESKIKQFKASIIAFTNWEESISNSFEYEYSNGYLEGIHNRIKSIKRAAFLMPNFERFRTKILLTLA